MPEPHPFRRAAEAKDVEALSETLREDVVLHSPVLSAGYEGREVVAAIMVHVAGILEDLTYVSELADARTVVLRFKANVGKRELDGIDFLELDEEGKVAALAVYMRPLTALTSFNERMAASLDASQGG